MFARYAKIAVGCALAVSNTPIYGGGASPVGPNELGTVNVAKGEVETASEAVVVAPEAQGLFKTGKGQYNLPADKLYFRQAKKLGVGAGQLNISLDKSGETPAFIEPTEALNKAALWFDASKPGTIITSEGAELADKVNVEAWLDVRETGTAEMGYKYARAVTQTNVFPDPGKKPWYAVADGGRKAISFGLARDGIYMAWIKPDGSTNSIANIYHLFAVYGVVKTHGFLLGHISTTWGSIGGPGDTTTGSIEGSLWTWQSWQAKARNFINGIQVDGYAEKVHKGFHLLEVAYAGVRINQASADSFFNDRNLDYLSEGSPNKETYAGHRVGGDYLSEVLVFDRKLTEEERIRIETYLMQKWNLADNTPQRNIGVASSANSKLGVSLGTENDAGDVQLSGDGEVRKTGTGDLYLQPGLNRSMVLSSLPVTPRGSYKGSIRAMLPTGEANEFEGTLKIEEGAAYLNAVVPLAVEAKDVITAEIVKSIGNKVTVANTGDNGIVKKTGNGIIAVNALDEGVGKMIAEGGTLILKAPKKAGASSAVQNNAGIEVAIPNPGFEEVEWEDDTRKFKRFTRTTYKGWTSVIEGSGNGNDKAMISGVGYRHEDGVDNTPVGGEDTGNFDYHLAPPRTGNGQLAIMGMGSSVYATIDIPVDGVYDLSFWVATATWEFDNKKVFDVIIEDADGVQKKVGAFSKKMKDTDEINNKYVLKTAYRQVCFKTPFLKAGAGQKLWFKAVTVDQNAAITIDDVKMALSPDTIKPGMVALPNGDLEDVPYDTMTSLYVNAAANKATGWEFTQSETWSSGRPTVAVVSRATTDYTDSFNHRNGEMALCFRLSGGVATMENVTLPAGTYNLTAVLGIKRDNGDKNGDKDIGNQGTGILAASVAINGETVSLGTVSQTRRIPTKVAWPNRFTLTKETTVDIAITQTTDSVIFADDFALERPDNLLVDGGFEQFGALDGGWTATTTYQEDGTRWGYVEKMGYNDGWEAMPDVAKSYFAGSFFVAFNRDAELSQNVVLPKAGRYRFTIHEFERENEYYERLKYEVLIKDENGVERKIGTGLFNSGNDMPHQFMRSDFEFAVEKAGKWTIIVRGVALVNQNIANTILFDEFSLTEIDDENYEATPQIAKTTKLEVAAGAKLHLDYPGELELYSVKFGGKVYNQGTYNAGNMGEYISGTGTIYVRDKGTRIFVR